MYDVDVGGLKYFMFMSCVYGFGAVKEGEGRMNKINGLEWGEKNCNQKITSFSL